MSMAMLEGSVDYPDGADPSPILALAQAFEDAERRLIGAHTQVDDALATAVGNWEGDAEENFAGHCRHDLAQLESAAQRCRSAAAALRSFAESISRFQTQYAQAAAKERWVRDQFDNRVGDFAEDLVVRWRGYVGEQRSAVEGLRDAAEACQWQLDRIAHVFAELFTDIDNPTSPTHPGPLVISTRPATSGLTFVQDSIRLTLDDTTIPADAIQVQQLSDGSYVVIAPGVRDLSNGGFLTEPLGVSDPVNTARKVKHTSSMALFDGDNLYAQRIAEALQAAGVPPGARVRLVGHSAGAYAAVFLASDRRFNSNQPTGGYYVNVTDVVSVGASNEWKVPSIPRRTNVLVVNNRQDVVVQGEDLAAPSTWGLPRDWNWQWSPRVTTVEGRPNQVLVRVNAGEIWKSGHLPSTYANSLPYLGREADERMGEFNNVTVVRSTNVQVPETTPPGGPWVRDVPVRRRP
jgi:uncharacterized protein YukE